MTMTQTRTFDATMRARQSSTGGPTYVNGGRIGQEPAEPARARRTVPKQPRHLNFQDWLAATGKNLRGPDRTEVCRQYECYRRGALYISPAERQAWLERPASDLVLETTAVVVSGKDEAAREV